jgi:uncharacterized damage-inducible protein DinB
MDREPVVRLFAFDRWANARFFDTAATLTGAQLGAPLVSSYPTILATFAHLVGSEWIWFERWKGSSPTAQAAWVAQPDLGELRGHLEDIERDRDRWLAGLSEDDLARSVRYRRLNGEEHENALIDQLVHVANHSTYHRGQLTTLFRQVGATPPNTDFVVFTETLEARRA